MCQCRDLDDVRIFGAHAIVNRLYVLGSLHKIMITDDAFGFSIAGDLPRDVFFQVNVVDTLGNCLTQQRQAVDVAGGPLAAIFLASKRLMFTARRM